MGGQRRLGEPLGRQVDPEMGENRLEGITRLAAQVLETDQQRALTYGRVTFERFNCLDQTGCNWAGILMAKRGRKIGWRSQPERNKKIVKRYQAGASAAELGELFGLSKERICQICREAGVIRKRGRPW